MPLPIVTKASSAATAASLTDNASGAAVLLTLPLSGRQGVLGGDAESLRWSVHSKGLFEVSRPCRQLMRAVAE